ncbi:helix-turn-helix transcriptional regulator [Fusobacterium varium]|uniref:helix-turn-helix domain-containing protein n=1 Tax=Fusobacterium TaxID=848 RepID=UPI0030CACB3B
MSKWIMIYDKCYQELIQEIRNVRVEKYTQKEFSRELGITQKTVSHYENCRSEINLKLLLKICKILDISFMKMMKNFLKQNNNEI